MAIALLSPFLRAADVLEVPLEFATVQAAVDAAQSGDMILVAPGTYHENIHVDADSLFLLGIGAVIDGRYLGPCLVAQGDWLDIEGFELRNGGVPGDSASAGGLLVTGSHTTLRALTVRACAGVGISIIGKGFVDSCTVEGCTGPGVRSGGTGLIETSTGWFNCVVRSCSVGLLGVGGPCHATDCTFEANRGAGIQYELELLDWQSFNRFEGNTVVDNGGAGIQCSHILGDPLGGYTDYRANQVERNEVGIALDGLKFAADYDIVRHNRAGGIDVDSAAFELNFSKIRWNGVFGVRHVNTFGSIPGSFGGILWNSIRDNGGDGLHFTGLPLTVEGGSVKANLGDGVSLDGDEGSFHLNHVHVIANGHDGVDNSATDTLLWHVISKGNGGADIAGLGDGTGTVEQYLYGNVAGDGTGVDSPQELELDTLAGGGDQGATLRVPSVAFGTIQSAVDAASAGDVIVVHKGRYLENVTVNTPDITLKGNGAIIDGHYAGNCLSIAASGVTIKGFKLVNGGHGNADAADDASGTGGVLAQGDHIRLAGLRVQACQDFGVSISGRDDELSKVRVEACGQGIIAEALGGDGTTLRHCKVLRCGTGFAGSGGPFVFDHDLAQDNLGDGMNLVVSAADGAPPVVTLTANSCLDNSGIGIALSGDAAPGSKITSNTCSGNGIGLQVELLLGSISGNTVERNRRGGMFVSATSTSIAENLVQANGLVGVVIAGLVDQGGTASGGNAVVSNEVIGNFGDGLDLACGSNAVGQNLLKLNLGDGIQIVGSTAGNKVESNEVLDNGHDGIDNSGNGTLISDNTCTGSGGADLAGLGEGNGTVHAASTGNTVGDDSGLQALQELELDTLAL